MLPFLLINLNPATATLVSTPYHFITKQKNLKEEEVKKEMKSQPKHLWCKKSCGQESKKGCAEKDVKLKWAAKASCC